MKRVFATEEWNKLYNIHPARCPLTTNQWGNLVASIENSALMVHWLILLGENIQNMALSMTPANNKFQPRHKFSSDEDWNKAND